MSETLHIFRKVLRNGVEIRIKRKKYKITYNQSVWSKFPKSLHKVFADSLSYIATWHLPLINGASVAYHFPHPPIEPVFFKILLYSIPMTVFENLEKNILTSDLLKNLYNANFLTQYKSLNYSYSGKKAKQFFKERAILLFSFGKDSLLTYGLLEELGIKIIPVFMKEPQSGFENAHKRKLANKFYDKIGEEIIFFPLSIGKLRQSKDLCWGWDIILSQYAFVLIPYYFGYQAKYLFFGNEQSCNFYIKDKEGFLVNPVFEQSVSAMQYLADIPKQFFINTHIGSLIEPIHDLFIIYILHYRYPDVGRFQMSCFSEQPEAKKRRWCGHCDKCARLYIYFKALNISPERVGFYNNNMFALEKEKYYVIFEAKGNKSAYGASGLGREEQLLAFYLAYKNGVHGELIDKFKSLYLKDIEKRKEKLINEYFSIHSSYSLPPPLRRRAIRVFEKERQQVLNYIKRITD